MKAHIVKRPRKNGGRVVGRRYYVVVELGRDPVTNKRTQKWHSAGNTKDEADDTLLDILKELNADTYIPPSNLTVSEYLDDYLRGLRKRFGQEGRRGLALGTWLDYRRVIENHLKPELGSLKLTELKAHHVEKYEARMLEGGWAHWGKKGKGERKRGLSTTSVLKHHRVLSKALGDAIRKGLITSNPCDAVDAPAAAITDLRVLDADECADLLRLSHKTPMEMPVLLALTTGMRAGEICALRERACELDGDEGHIRVLRSATEDEHGARIETLPKYGKTRSITIDRTTVAALKARRTGRAVRNLRGDDYLVSDETGAPLSSNDLSAAWRSFAKQNGVKRLRFHDLRHSHATMLAAAGEHPRVVQERLGHRDVAFTLRRYTAYWSNMQAGAAEKIERLFGAAIAPAARVD